MKTMRIVHWIRLYDAAAQQADDFRQYPTTAGLPELIEQCATELRAAEAARLGRGPEVTAAEALAEAREKLHSSHRLAYGVASAFALDGPPAVKADIDRMVRFVWPEKLMVVRHSFTEKASSGATFRERSGEAVAAAGHRAMEALVPGWPQYIDDVPAAADDFADALAALEASRETDIWSPAEARQEARALFGVIMAAVDFACRGGQPEAIMLRSALTRRYRELRAQAREAYRRGEGPEDVNDAGSDVEESVDEPMFDGRPPVPDAQEPISAPVAGLPGGSSASASSRPLAPLPSRTTTE